MSLLPGWWEMLREIRKGNVNLSWVVVLIGCLVSVPAVLISYEQAGGDVSFLHGARVEVTSNRPNPVFDVAVKSADGRAELVQTAISTGCLVSCRRGDALVWSSEGPCVGEQSSRYFLSDDCEDLVAVNRGQVKRFARATPVASPSEESWALLWEPRYARDGRAVEAESDGSTLSVPLRRP